MRPNSRRICAFACQYAAQRSGGIASEPASFLYVSLDNFRFEHVGADLHFRLSALTLNYLQIHAVRMLAMGMIAAVMGHNGSNTL